MTVFRRARATIVLIALMAILAACGDIQEQSLCRQWEDVEEVAAELQALDPATATGEDVTELVEQARGELDQVWSTAEGLYEKAISDFRASLVGLREAASDAGGTSLEVARPLIEDAWAETQTAYQVLADRINLSCDAS